MSGEVALAARGLRVVHPASGFTLEIPAGGIVDWHGHAVI